MLSARKEGNIGSIFANSFKGELPVRYADLKKEISPKDPSVIQNAWVRLESSFEKEAPQIKALGSKIIPQVNYQDILNGEFPSNMKDEIKKRGCVVVRGIVPTEVAEGYKQQVLDYIAAHPGQIPGFPEHDQQVWELYWSKAQVEARSHPHFVQTTTALNKLWNAQEDSLVDLETNLTYCDRLRIRKPNDESFVLREHIDGGSVERWEDSSYRKCFSNILAGEWEKHDSYDVANRLDAKMQLYDAPGGCEMFRTFQGWLALSNSNSGCGSLRVCPLVKETTAAIIMRPLLQDILETSSMGGAYPGTQIDIDPVMLPQVTDICVSIPDVSPGDAVFWHCDLVHAVDSKCLQSNDASVFYIPATPLCNINTSYVRRQRETFRLGLTPPDFPGNNAEKDFDDRAKPEDLSKLGKLGMGFERIEPKHKLTKGAQAAVDKHNHVLNFD
ncbi:hypothetical protein BB559_007315 [Furculomyces boomerangus]|uniref:DUF1479 domain protein n=1 Tax=Furculomyces boomerangus TaxID=61424 RepID=A0A2T9XXW3_9FUNG|nr:hypothetical protein BB559_007315 [Furculomyces boomerangus]